MFKTKHLITKKITHLVRATALPALLLTSSFSFAVSDEEMADLKARLATLEATPSWSSTESQAAEALSIHGFVNAGVSSSNTDDIAVVSGGIGDEMNYQAHQSFGMQIGYQLDEKTDVVAQMLGRAYQDNMNVRMNWAYIGRSLVQDKGAMSDLKLRVGRAPADIYMISEYYDVGYAYPWVVPPREAYDLLGGVPYDGIDLTASFSLPSDWNMQLKGFIGEVNVDPRAGKTDRIDLKKIRGVNVIVERDAWRLRAGYGQAIVKYEICCGDVTGFETITGGYNALEAGYEELVAGIQSIDPSFTPSYTATPITDTDDNLAGSFSGVGFSYDNGDWLVMGEYMFQKWDTFNPDMDLAYVTVGKRFGEWMPYVTAAQAKVADDDDATELADKIADMKANLADPQVAAAISGATGVATAGQATAEGAISAGEAILADYANGSGDTNAVAFGTCTALGLYVDETQCTALGLGAIAQGQAGLAQAQAGLADLAALEDGLASFNANSDLLSGGFTGLNLPQKTYSIGVRYDFAPGATAKLQVDKVTGFEDSRGSLENAYVSHFTIQATF